MVKKSVACFAILSCLVVAVVIAQDDEGVETRGRANGRFWKKLDANNKAFLMVGFSEGLVLWRDMGEKKEADQFRIEGFSISEIVQQIDAFYSDSANVRVPITWAYLYANRKMTGAKSESELKDYAASLRRFWGDKPPEK